MAVDDLGEDIGQIGLRIDGKHFAGCDQRGQNCPMFATAIGAGEEMILAPERHHPLILPMSGRSWRSITAGIPILAARLSSGA